MNLLSSLSIGVKAEKMFLIESHQKVIILATPYGASTAKKPAHPTLD